MKVSPKIATGEKVTADRTLCSTSAKSPPATAVNQLKPPIFVGPICPGQSVTVGDTTINATLVLIKNTSTLVGYGGGAVPGDVALKLAPPNVLALNDKVQVAEYIGSQNLVQWTINSANRPALAEEAQAPFASGQDGGGFTSISSNGRREHGDHLGRRLSDEQHGRARDARSTPRRRGHEYAGLWPNTGGNANIVPTVANGMVYVASNNEL